MESVLSNILQESECFLLRFQLLFLQAIITQISLGYPEIFGILESNANELTHEEIKMLVPFFDVMQQQCDLIINQNPINDSNYDEKFMVLYNETIKEIFHEFGPLMQLEPTIVYNTTLPILQELMDRTPDFTKMTLEEFNEYLVIQSVFQASLDEAQEGIDALSARALQVESDLLKLNKPQIIINIFKALRFMFKASARFGRAAYCTYSNIPQLNASLHHLYDGVDCYLFATSMIVKVQNEVIQTSQIVRESVLDLASIYKKISSKNSNAGIIVSLTKNSMNILRSILRTLRQANHVIDEVVHELPEATLEFINCGENFVNGIPLVVQSVVNTTTCIMYTDDTKQDYDWMEPENSTRIPELIPDPESGEITQSFEMT